MFISEIKTRHTLRVPLAYTMFIHRYAVIDQSDSLTETVAPKYKHAIALLRDTADAFVLRLEPSAKMDPLEQK